MYVILLIFNEMVVMNIDDIFFLIVYKRLIYIVLDFNIVIIIVIKII